MDDLVEQVAALAANVDSVYNQLNIEEKRLQLERIRYASAQPDFWENPMAAQSVMKELSELQDVVDPWVRLLDGVREVQELAKLGDADLTKELGGQLAGLQSALDNLKKEMAYSGPYDNHDVLLSVFSGAGGTDAQDWAQMLVRMYTRWAESNKYKVKLLEQSSGDEAGIKSATIEISGPNMYGKLKGEHGVHRLVRLSPFNSDNLRQTSFARVEVVPKIERSSELELDDKDLKVDVYRSGGHGGQSVNTTDSAVRITHLPTGITVAIQNERSQLQNKETALIILRSKLAQLQMEQHQAKLSELKGPNEQASWGNQIRSYVMHPYSMVKDLRTRHETSDVQAVLEGKIDPFIGAYQDYSVSTSQ